MSDLDGARERMLRCDLAGRGIADPAVLRAMGEVPREAFVPEHLRTCAYDDQPLPIGAGQTISQPFIVAYMIEAAGLGPEQRVLEVGGGSGYAAAVMSRICERVFAVERHPELAEAAGERLRWLGYANVEMRCGDGTRGWPEAAPFDAILVAAGGEEPPESLCGQLSPGGRLILPLGGRDGQRLIRLTRSGGDRFERDDLGGVMFVPLVGGKR